MNVICSATAASSASSRSRSTCLCNRVDTGDRDAKPPREFDRVTALATPNIHQRISRDRFEACEQIPQALWPARLKGLIEAMLDPFLDAGVVVARFLDRDLVRHTAIMSHFSAGDP